MDLGLKDKVALVAASSKGLGKAAATTLAQEGAKITICSRDEKALNATADQLRQAGAPDVLVVPTDLTKAKDIDNLVKKTLDHFGQVDILFTNNAGPPAAYFWDLDDEAWSTAIDLQVMSTIRLIRGVLPGMRERKWGRIICDTSIAAVQPGEWAHLVLTTTVRSGIHGLAKTLAHNLATEGITVNCVAPGPILTDRTDELAKARAAREGISYDDAVAAMGQLTAIKRLGRVEEFGPAVAFLASEQASFITGVTLRVDGGEHTGLL